MGQDDEVDGEEVESKLDRVMRKGAEGCGEKGVSVNWRSVEEEGEECVCVCVLHASFVPHHSLHTVYYHRGVCDFVSVLSQKHIKNV